MHQPLLELDLATTVRTLELHEVHDALLAQPVATGLQRYNKVVRVAYLALIWHLELRVDLHEVIVLEHLLDTLGWL